MDWLARPRSAKHEEACRHPHGKRAVFPSAITTYKISKLSLPVSCQIGEYFMKTLEGKGQNHGGHVKLRQRYDFSMEKEHMIMAITNQTVLKKMSSEIQEAMLQHGDQQKVREHVRSVKLLADLLLEEESSTTQSPSSVQEPTVEEIRKMMGADKQPSSSQSIPQSKQETKSDHEEANGSSIFDF